MIYNALDELEALPNLTVLELMAKWRRLMNTEPPVKNRGFLESRLAFRIQTLAFGGLKPETKKRLRRLVEHEVSGAPISPQGDKPATGAVLVREHNGTEHRVKVLQEGFEYDDRKYRSLSAIAKQITGTNWNGPVFFGLRRKA